MFVSGKNNPAVVGRRTGVESLELSAQMVRLEPGIIDIRRHAPQSGFNGRLQRGIFSNHAAERPFKPWRGDEFVHGSLGGTQAGDEAVRRLRLELASAKGGGGILGFGGSGFAPGFDAAFAQQVFQKFLLVGRQMSGVYQNAIQGGGVHNSLWIIYA